MSSSQRRRPLRTSDRYTLLSRFVDEFERRGWREDGYTALSIVRMMSDARTAPTRSELQIAVSPGFLTRNHTNIESVASAINGAIEKIR